MRDWAPITIIALLFAIFTQLFSTNTPYRKSGILLHQRGTDGLPAHAMDIGAPDERQHANYVKQLMDGAGFPVLNPNDPNLYESYQAHQPPLFYILSAGFCKLFGIDPTSESGFHSRDLNLLIGLATVFGVFFGSLWIFGSRVIANCASAFCLLPMCISLHGALSNDPLLICLCTWTIALLAKCFGKEKPTKLLIIVAILIGLALLTKTTAIALLPCLFIALFLMKKPEASGERLIYGIALCIPLIIALPWWLRNVQLYGDFLAVKAFTAAFTGSPQASVFIEGLGGFGYWANMVTWWTARSAIGVFGYMDIFMFEGKNMIVSNQLYLALLFLISIPFLAGFWGTAKNKELRKPMSLFWCYSALILLLFIRFNTQYFQGQARYLYPALAPFAWITGAGVQKCLSRLGNECWIAPVILFVALNSYVVSTLQASFAARLM